MKIAIHKAKYRHSQWYYYLKPKRLTLSSNPAIYKWLFWTIALNKEEYQKLRLRQGQRTFIYCPKCDNELISSNSFVKDTDFVYYKCINCGAKSKWDFDFLTPILVEDNVIKQHQREIDKLKED